MNIGLYFDEDSMDKRLIQALRARGITVLTALDANMIHKSDEVYILQFATNEGYVLCSFNVGDFMKIHNDYLVAGNLHRGIMLARQQHYSVGGTMRRLLKLIATKTVEEMVNYVEFLSTWD